MKLEDQVITEKQADLLKGLGIIQEALYYHTHSEKWGVMPRKSIDFKGDPSAAFTVAELGILLPAKFEFDGHNCFPSSERYSEQHPWISGIHTVWAHDKPVVAKKYFPGQTEAQVRADLLIYLLAKKIIDPEQANARLSK